MAFPQLLLIGMLALAPSSTETAPLNLYDWVARAPVVLLATHGESAGRFDHFVVERALRGEAAADTRIRVRVRRANRERDPDLHADPLRLEPGESYVLLLTPESTRRADAPATFELVRGVRGAQEIPREGREAYVGALERLVLLQNRKDERATWRELTGMLAETNPVLVETALEQFIKFQRGRADHLETLRPLLDHPSQGLRERTTLLIGQILRLSREPLPQMTSLRSDLISRARRDSAVPVRIAATRALGDIDDETVLRILEEIAREDPDQRVRYTAEKLIYERAQRRSTPEQEVERSANGT